ncbi:MAG: hypothetical protein ABSE16_08615 [Verrucomicrobiota bacterium]|jgi:septal ring factor EnvC (AmiA/AmiB activator)
MFVRISLIVAILAALAVGVLNFVVVKDKITTLTTDRNTQRSGRIEAETERDRTNKVLVATQGTLKQTQQDLATAKKDRDAAVATADSERKRADDLNDRLSKAVQDRDEAQGELAAYKDTGLSAKQVADLSRTLKDAQTAISALNDEKVVMNRSIERLRTRLAVYEGTNKPIELRADLRGKILVVDPKWDFVVLNVGEDQGVLVEGSELLVSRSGKLVAKVRVTSIQKDRSIANVMPGWKLGDVIEGDEVTPAYPAST